MITLEDEKDIEKVFSVCINTLKKQHLLRRTSDAIYDDVSKRLYAYYKNGEKDRKIKRALQDFKDDLYICVIPFYYKDGYTIENIAEMMNIDTSTVVRNKKRLCLSIYGLIE